MAGANPRKAESSLVLTGSGAILRGTLLSSPRGRWQRRALCVLAMLTFMTTTTAGFRRMPPGRGLPLDPTWAAPDPVSRTWCPASRPGHLPRRARFLRLAMRCGGTPGAATCHQTAAVPRSASSASSRSRITLPWSTIRARLSALHLLAELPRDARGGWAHVICTGGVSHLSPGGILRGPHPEGRKARRPTCRTTQSLRGRAQHHCQGAGNSRSTRGCVTGHGMGHVASLVVKLRTRSQLIERFRDSAAVTPSRRRPSKHERVATVHLRSAGSNTRFPASVKRSSTARRHSTGAPRSRVSGRLGGARPRSHAGSAAHAFAPPHHARSIRRRGAPQRRLRLFPT